MSKLINPKDYLTLKNYSIKYNISNRKLYRYIDHNDVDIIYIDGIPFIKDKKFSVLIKDNRCTNVKSLTKDQYNVETLTIKSSKNTDNQLVNNVKISTLDSDKILTLSKKEISILNKPDSECTIDDFKKKQEIVDKIN